MKNLKYEKLEAQKYLTMLDVNLAKTDFRFRVRMAQFSGNYKGQGPPEPCPLCGLHSDVQHQSFQCSAVTRKIKISEKYENLFKPNISTNLAKICQEIVKLRRKEEWTALRGAQLCTVWVCPRWCWVLQAKCFCLYILFVWINIYIYMQEILLNKIQIL